MNEETNQLLSQEIINKLYELCNYDEIVENVVKEKGLRDVKINNIDIQYLLRNDSVKDMLTFLVNKIKSSSDIQKTREKIKVYSIYKEKIDKINVLEKRKQELINQVKEKNSKLISEKERLNKCKTDNLLLKNSLEQNRDNINLMNTKNQIITFSKLKADTLLKDFEQSLEKTQEFKKEISSSVMMDKDNFEDFLKSNTEYMEKQIKEDKFKDKKVLPFYKEDLNKQFIFNHNFNILTDYLKKRLEDNKRNLESIRHLYEIKQSENTIILNESSNNNLEINSKFEILITNYKTIIEKISKIISNKQKNITIKFNLNRDIKYKLDELKKINNETLKNNNNIFVNPILNSIKSIVEESLNKDLVYQIKVENEKVSILNKKIEKESLGLEPTIQYSNDYEIKEGLESVNGIFNLIKKYKAKIDGFIGKHLLPLSNDLEEKFIEFQNLVKNEFNLFLSFNTCQRLSNHYKKSIYSFKIFTYDTNMLYKARIFNKKDVFNKFMLLINLLSCQQKQLVNDNNIKKCFNDENLVQFLNKNEKIKTFIQFYQQEFPHHNKFLHEKINNSIKNTQRILENIKDFMTDLNSLIKVKEILEDMPDGLKQIINLWMKSNK